MTRACPCGNVFDIAQWQLRQGRGKYCSRACMYKYRVRPKGLKYEIKVNNKGWIAKGQRLSPTTEFQPGETPHNFKGDAVGYAALHDWVRRHKGYPVRCEHCGRAKKLQWANKSGKYRRRLNDWLALCYWCHRKFDKENGWGKIDVRFERRPSNCAGGVRK